MPQQSFELDHAGRTIRGTTYRPTNPGRRPTVVFLHGFTGQRMENGFLFVRLARALAEAGIASVTFDFLNSGESDGSFENMLPTGELADALRVTEWAQRQSFADRSRLALLGFSLGGLLAACVTARAKVYKALVMLAPTTEANISRHAQREGKSDACSVLFGPHCLHPKFFVDVASLDSVRDVVKNPRPTLLVQGTADTAVPPAVSQQFIDAMKQARVPCDARLIEGADHPFAHPSWRKDLIDTVVAWLERQLK
jgi:dipeptidyl aminopeptidase/acylaminoacyl peptidase